MNVFTIGYVFWMKNYLPALFDTGIK